MSSSTWSRFQFHSSARHSTAQPQFPHSKMKRMTSNALDRFSLFWLSLAPSLPRAGEMEEIAK